MGDPALTTPGSGVSPEPTITLPPDLQEMVDQFTAEVATTNGPSTVKTYKRHARVFLEFVSQNGWSLESMPADAPARLYAAKGWAAGTSNIWSSGLIAFEKWVRARNLPYARLEYPARQKTAKRKKTAPSPEFDTTPARSASVNPLDPQEEDPMSDPAVHANSNGHGPSDEFLDGIMGDPPSDSAPAPAPVAPARPAPSPASPTARPRVVSRNARTKDPLHDFMPPGGFLRVSKRAQGGGPHAAGKVVLIGDYNVNDLNGLTDPVAFVHRFIRPEHGPFPGESDMTYVVTRYSQDGVEIAGGLELPVAAPRTGINTPSTGGFHSGRTSSPWGVHGDRASYLEQKLLEAQDTLRVETEAKMNEVMDEIKKIQSPPPPVPGQPAPAPRVLTEAEIRGMIDAAQRSVNRVAVERLENELERERRRSPAPQTDDFGFDNADPVPIAPRAAPAPSAGDVAMQRLMDQNETLLARALAPPPVPVAAPVHVETEEDREERQLRKWQRMKELFAPPPVPAGPSPDILALKDMLQTQANQISRLAEQIASGGNLTAEIAKMRALRTAAEEVVGMQPGGEPSWKEILPEMMKEGTGMLKAIFGGAPLVRPALGGAPGQPAQQTAPAPGSSTQQVPPPAAATSAVMGMRDADPKSPEFEKAVVNGFFSLLSSLSNAPAVNGQPNPWAKVKDVILNALKQAQVKAQLTALVVDTFALLGRQDAVAKPGLVDGVTNVLWMRYHEIHAAVWGQERFLADRPVADVRGVAAAPAAPAAAPAAAPTPAPAPANEPADLTAPPAVDPAVSNPDAFRQPKAPPVEVAAPVASPDPVPAPVPIPVVDPAVTAVPVAPLAVVPETLKKIRVADLSPEEMEKLCDWVNDEMHPCRLELNHAGEHEWDPETVMEEQDDGEGGADGEE